jgi:hypothetical protein
MALDHLHGGEVVRLGSCERCGVGHRVQALPIQVERRHGRHEKHEHEAEERVEGHERKDGSGLLPETCGTRPPPVGVRDACPL